MVIPRYLADTSILSKAGGQHPSPALARNMSRRQQQIATAAPVYQELLYGMHRLPPSRRRRDVERFVLNQIHGRIAILPYDTDAAAWHAAERARLESIGRTPPFVDGQIAAIAAVNGLILVTANVRDFEQFRDLLIEDWTG